MTQLQAIAQRFGRQAQVASQLGDQLQARPQPLQEGDWVCRVADSLRITPRS